MVKRSVASLLALWLAGCSLTEDAAPDDTATTNNSNEPNSMEAYCENNDCRRDHTLNFKVGKETFEQTLPIYWPVVMGDRISLLPGDEVFVEARVNEGTFTDFKQVDTVTDPAQTISFRFTQMDDSDSMMLVVNNPFKETMKYHVMMLDFEGNTHETSSCPVRPGMSVFEHWPHVIPEIVMFDFRVLGMTDRMTCEF